MAFSIIQGNMQFAVANGSTISFSYPTGEASNLFDVTGIHQIFVNQRDYFAPGSFTVTFGALVAVTNLTGITWASGTQFYLQIEKTAQTAFGAISISANTNTPLAISGTINDYFEANVKNSSSGVTGSSDIVCTADTGTATTNYVDLGINGSGYTGGIMGAALEGYLYASDQSLNIGATAAGKVVRVLAGGSSVGSNTVATFSSAGLVVTGTLGASNFSGSSSGTNTGDNAVNTLYSGLVSNATHTGDATGSTALTVVRINGVALSGLATGLLKNTTTTGAPSIAAAGTDYEAALGNPGTSGFVLSSTTGGARSWIAASSSGTVTSASVTTANGVSGTVATATTTPAITLTLGAITPASVAASGIISAAGSAGAATSTATPTLFASDSTYGNQTAGKNLKLKIYQANTGATADCGLGIAAGSFEYVSVAGAAHNWYVNAATPSLLMTLSTTGALTTTAGITSPAISASSTLSSLGSISSAGAFGAASASSTPTLLGIDSTYGNNLGGLNFKLKLHQNSNTGVTSACGFGIEVNYLEYVSTIGSGHKWYVNAATPSLLMTLSASGALTTTAGLTVGGGTTLNSIFSAVKSAFDCPSIAANGGVQTTTLTVTGATTSSVCVVSLPSGGINAGVVVDAYVSAADTVTIRFTNCTAAAIDPVSANFRVMVTNF